MARQFVVLALIFFAILGMASARANAPSESPISLGQSTDNDIIGTTDGSASDFGAAPVGGPVSAGTFTPFSPAEAPNGASAIFGASTLAGVVVSAFVGSLFL
ncbi:hypothetical protein ACH5RR_030781 [Cinchona calisaya]|uniref:Anther-specific protein BCP1 n=1 Tax=Cinchona calisaya TaxID=153742 RepID=A0ABD2YZ37_9GENT